MEKMMTKFSTREKVILFIVFMGFGALVTTIFNYSNYEQVGKDVVYIKTETGFLGIVELRLPNKSDLVVKLTSDKKYSIPWGRNMNYEKYELQDFVRVNDSLVKKAGTDTLFVLRNGKQYYFVFSKIIKKGSK